MRNAKITANIQQKKADKKKRNSMAHTNLKHIIASW